ncbi:MAG: SDR family NAD(P)-dependent oxidoreductase [Deltaproteobacteria bacterium]|jgi:acyl transferase domain-containing protein/NAD(P)-dependent dehydrogenase (short-subunit alcohol dehydrogenase family)|nr:SDR family NAD(P)-dependent oxidoreductase [Deltaproteobacteria bacterium]
MSYEIEKRLDAPDQAVAVIGLSALFPGQPGLAGYWRAIKNGEDAITDIPLDRFDPSDYYDADPKARDRMYCRRGAFLSPTPFEPLKFGVTPRDLETIDSSQLLGLVVSDAALTDAGYPADRADHSRTAVIMGVTGGLEMLGHMSSRMAYPQVKKALEANGLDPALIEKILASYGDQFAPWRESSFPGLLGNVVAGRIANRLNLGGANMVVDAACASSLAAVSQALLELKANRADLVVTGGIDTFTDPFMFSCFCKTPALSPTEEIRPYDQGADGALLGEGLGILVLKRLTQALRDEDRIYAIIRGLGASSDGRATSIFAPSPQGQLRAMRAAYEAAGFSPATVELVEGHGTGTQAGDNAEVSALIELMAAERPEGQNHSWSALGSVKSQIGHAKAAAGAAGLIKVILSLYHKILPPTIKARKPLAALADPACPLYLNDEARPWLAQAQSPRRAAVSSFGFGGSNFHCLLEEGPAPKPLDASGHFLIPFSGPDPKAIFLKMEELHGSEAGGEDRGENARDLDAQVRPLYSHFKPEERFRLVLTGDPGEIAEAWPEAKRLLTALESGQYPNWPAGFHWSAQTRPKPLRLISRPLGSFEPEAYQNLGRELALAFPVYQATLDLANTLSPYPLGKILFPPRLAANLGQYPEALTSSPYLATVCALAQASLWSTFGLALDSAEGFGSGVLPAAFLAGSLTLKEALELARSYVDPQIASDILANLTWNSPRTPLYADDQEIKDLSELRAALTKALETPRPLWSEYHQDPQETYLIIGPVSGILGHEAFNRATFNRDCLRLPDSDWSVAALAEIVGSLASQGHRLALHLWPTSPATHAAPTGHYLNLTGANLFNARKALQKTTPEPQIQRPVAANAQDSLSGATLKEFLVLQSETLGALRELIQETRLYRLQGPAFQPSHLTALNPTPDPLPGFIPIPTPQAPLEPRPAAATIAPAIAPPMAPQTLGEGSYGATLGAIVEILAQETGYPQDSLTESMDLEDDLGLDSIKRVELLALLADRFPGAKVAQSQPRTLGELASLCHGSRVDENAFIEPTTPISVSSSSAQSSPELNLGSKIDPKALVLDVLAQETGYPKDSLKPELDLEIDLGLDSIKRVEILSTLSERLPNLSPAALSGAATLGQLIEELAKSLDADDSSSQTSQPVSQPSQPVSQPISQPSQPVSKTVSQPISQSGVFSSQEALALVAQETGYPVESLSPELELENDLGLDSIKRVEILSALAEKAPHLSQEQGTLAEARTLGDWLAVFEPAPKPDSRPEPATAVILKASHESGPIFSPETLDPPKRGNGKGNGRALLDEALLRESPPSLFKVEPEICPPETGPSPWPSAGLARLVGTDKLSKALAKELKERGFQVESHSWRADFASWNTPTDLLFLVWPGPDRGSNIITQALKALAVSGPHLKAVVGLSFLGGSFGFPRPLEPAPQGNSTSGSLVGLLKCAAREWPNVATRALDLPLAVYEMPHNDWVSAILDNAAAPGPVELGLPSLDRLIKLSLKPYAPEISPEPCLNPGETVVVTGGGKGVTAAVLAEMAKTLKPRFIILGRTPIGPPEPAWLASLSAEKEIKAGLHQHGGGQLTPKELGERTRLILSSRELKKNLAILEAAGAQVEYISGDFTSPKDLEAVARRLKSKYGPIRGFIHGAGVLADHPILGKSQDDFARVYATKTLIAAQLLEAFQTEPLRLVVFFSSSTARFGRQGQSDYAAGNEVLNKTAWELRLTRPNTRVLAVNWGPWAGGMVNETLAGQFHAQGVGLIGLKAGAETFTRLIRSPVEDPAEVVVLGPGTNLAALTAYARGQN